MIITIFHLVYLLLVMRNDTIIWSRFFRPFVCLFLPNTRRSERKDRLCAPENNFESNISKAINFIIFSLSHLRSFSCFMEVLKLLIFCAMKRKRLRLSRWEEENQNLELTKNAKKIVIRKSSRVRISRWPSTNREWKTFTWISYLLGLVKKAKTNRFNACPIHLTTT